MFCRHLCFHPFCIFTCYWSLDVAISWFNVVTHQDVIIEEFFCSFQQAMILWIKKITSRNNKHQCKNCQPFNSIDCQKLQSLLVDFLLRSSDIEKGLTAKLNICICTLEFLSAWEDKNRKTVFSMDADNKSWMQTGVNWHIDICPEEWWIVSSKNFLSENALGYILKYLQPNMAHSKVP